MLTPFDPLFILVAILLAAQAPVSSTVKAHELY
jgi:hypothetical protein